MNALSIVLPPLSLLYRAATQVRLALYRRGTFPITRLDAFVVSVGNITTGGTGKTPLVERLAQILCSEGRSVCILTRGYGRSDTSRRIVVSDGHKVLATSEEAGDEPFLLATNLAGTAAVISDADRVSAARWTIGRFGSDTFVLDDGFQHLRLARDLNIVTIDATDPWGGGQLLPYGRLREPLSSLERADCIVITRTDHVDNIAMIIDQLARLSDQKPVFLSQMRTCGFHSVTGEVTTNSPEAPIAAFCGIANPAPFFQMLAETIDVALTRAFPDHHAYNEKDVRSFTDAAKRAGARSLVTTAKDAVKLTSFPFDLSCYVLRIEPTFEDEQGFLGFIRDSLFKWTAAQSAPDAARTDSR